MPNLNCTEFHRCRLCQMDLSSPTERPYKPGELTWSAGPNCRNESRRRAALETPVTVLIEADCPNAESDLPPHVNRERCKLRRATVTVKASCVRCGADCDALTEAELIASGGAAECQPDCETARKQRQAASEWGALVDTVETVKILLRSHANTRSIAGKRLGDDPGATSEYVIATLRAGGKSDTEARGLVMLAQEELKRESN